MKTIYLLGMLLWPIVILQYVGKQNLAELAMTLAQGPLVMGFFVAALSWIAGNKCNDSFSWKVLCVSLALLIVWLGLVVPTEFGFGKDFTGQSIVISLLLFGAAAGHTYGTITWRSRYVVNETTASARETRFSKDANRVSPIASGSIKALPGLFWFVLGILLAIGITLLAGWISFHFVDRGPVTMRTEWGGEIHADDNIVNAATGLVITIIGWGVGLASWRCQFPRPLTVGIIVGATLLGTFFALDW